MFVKLYKTVLIFFVSSVYIILSGREILHADNVDRKQIIKDGIFEKKEQTKNTIVIDVNGKVRTGGVPEDVSKIINKANNAVKMYGTKDDNTIVIINDDGKTIEQQNANRINMEKQEIYNSDTKKVKQKKHIIVDKELFIEKNGKIKPLNVVDENGDEFLIEFQKPAKIKCDNVCGNFTDKVVANNQKTNTNKQTTKKTNVINKGSVKNNKMTTKKESFQKNKQEKTNISSNNGNKRQNKFISGKDKVEMVVYPYKNNKKEKHSIKANNQQMDSIKQIHCIGKCKKQKPKKMENDKYNTSQYKILDISNVSGNKEKTSGNDNQNFYIINNIVGIDEDMVITADMIKKIEEKNTKNKNIKQNTFFIKQNNGRKSEKSDTIKVLNAEQRDAYLASLIENVSVADNVKFGEVAFVDNSDGI